SGSVVWHRAPAAPHAVPASVRPEPRQPGLSKGENPTLPVQVGLPEDSGLSSDFIGPPEWIEGSVQVAPALSRLNLAVYAPVSLRRDAYDQTVTDLNGLGLASVIVDRTPHTIRASNVRYYHVEDAQVAADIADAIGATARDFTETARRPALGTIEVWLSGPGARQIAEETDDGGVGLSLRHLRDTLARIGEPDVRSQAN
ncbi:MAG: hypothetical protein AAFX00_07200, partial [Pseudomonadota bacterium]